MTSEERLQAMKVLQERRAFLDWKRSTLSELAGFSRVLEDCKGRYAPKTPDEPWSPLFYQSCNDSALVDLYTYILEQAPAEDQRALFAERATTIEALSKRVTALSPIMRKPTCKHIAEAL